MPLPRVTTRGFWSIWGLPEPKGLFEARPLNLAFFLNPAASNRFGCQERFHTVVRITFQRKK